jgi:hypothetical protein
LGQDKYSEINLKDRRKLMTVFKKKEADSILKSASDDSRVAPKLQNAEVSWNKTDRIAIMTAGGAALGSAIALLPGAIIGGLLAATYGGYISFIKPRSARNP